tara:strand:- start:140 stop:319 length:180 start_codon:yes stop_codon:yes gene_type:complete
MRKIKNEENKSYNIGITSFKLSFLGASCSDKKNNVVDYTTVTEKSKDAVEHGQYLVTIM